MFQRLPKGTVREDEQPIDFTVTKDHLTYSEGDILELGGPSVGLGVQYFAASTDTPLLYTSTCFWLTGEILGKSVEGALFYDNAYFRHGRERKDYGYYNDLQIMWNVFANCGTSSPTSSRTEATNGWHFMSEHETPALDGLVIGILGGTGPQGRGLARRFAMAGHQVIIGSRNHDRAYGIAREIGHDVRGLANRDAAREASLVIAAVPWEGHAELLAGLTAELAGKIMVDCVNPLGFDQRGAFPLPVPEGSAAEQAAALLSASRVVAAFHHVSAVLLLDSEVDSLDQDVLVLGDDRYATDLVQALAGRIPGVRGIYAGRLRNCGQIEALTANLVSINRRYKAHAGLRVTDI